MTDDTNPFPPPDILDFTEDFRLATPALTQELERLQEGTFFSVLNDFVDDSTLLPGFVESNKFAEASSCKDTDHDASAINNFLRSLAVANPSNLLPEVVKPQPSVPVKQSSSCAASEHKPKKTAVKDYGQFLRDCIEHDHSYCFRCDDGSHKGCNESSGSQPHAGEVDTSTEEENSDTGYETTSPAVTSTVVIPPIATPSSSSFPDAVIHGHGQYLGDPVALIDSRIKHFTDNQQVCLTEEEKETLRAEGMPIPTTLPLTKVEEKALKAVRRKLRNKVRYPPSPLSYRSTQTVNLHCPSLIQSCASE